MIRYFYDLDYDDGTRSFEKGSEAKLETSILKATNEKTKVNSERNQAESTSSNAAEVTGQHSNQPRHEQTGVDMALASLLANVHVYFIADKYGIAELKDLARTKFLAQSQLLLSPKLDLRVIKDTYETTPNSARGLRGIIASVCATDIKSLFNVLLSATSSRRLGYLVSILYAKYQRYTMKQTRCFEGQHGIGS